MRRTILGLFVLSLLALPLTLGAQQPDEPVYTSADGVTLPKIIKEVKPYYTPSAMRERVQGSVILDCVVSKEGIPTRIEVKQALHDELDKEAIAALEQWRFTPGEKDGKPVAVRIAVHLTFTLK